MRTAAIALIVLSIAATANAVDGEETTGERANNVRFGGVRTGMSVSNFIREGEPYRKAESMAWVKFETLGQAGRIWAPAPEGMTLSRNVLSLMTVTPVSGSRPACSSTPRMLFVSGPPGGPGARLYAYEYMICDSSGLLNPGILIDQYITKYGIYDWKNYDLDMIVYKNVLGRYRVGARPAVSEDGRAAIVITVVDDDVFKEAYFAWRRALREAYTSIRDRF
ncbi:MAG: hypothetical protein ACNS63_07245 [Candidatus Nitrospinota bacterium M3_3B_026]